MNMCTPFQPATGGKWLLTSSRDDFRLFTVSVVGLAIPGVDIGFLDGPKGGSANPLVIMGDTLSYDTLPFTFIVDNKFENFTTLFNRLKELANTGYPQTEDLVVTMLDGLGKESGVKFQFKNAHIFQLSSFQLISNQQGENVLVSTASFRFQDMDIVTNL